MSLTNQVKFLLSAILVNSLLMPLVLKINLKWVRFNVVISFFFFTQSLFYLIWFCLAACLEPLGLENFQIPDISISASSYGRSKERVRLGYYNKDMWCAQTRDLNQFVQVSIAPFSKFSFSCLCKFVSLEVRTIIF